MSRLIPIRLAELAVEAKELQVKFLTDENQRVQNMLNDERAKIEVLLKNNYRLRNAHELHQGFACMSKPKNSNETLEFVHALDSIAIKKQKEEIERLTDALNKMTNTPDGVYGVDVKVNFWTKDGSRLPSSYQTFWTNEAKEGKHP